MQRDEANARQDARPVMRLFMQPVSYSIWIRAIRARTRVLAYHLRDYASWRSWTYVRFW